MDMKIIKDYLAEKKVSFGNDQIQSISEFLCWHYAPGNSIETQVLREKFSALNRIMDLLTLKQQDAVLDLVHEICQEYEKKRIS